MEQETVTIALQSLFSLGIVGVGFSLAIQFIKTKFGTTSNVTKAITFFGSIALGAAVYFLSALPIWANIIGVLAAASTTYAFVFSGKKEQ